MNKQRNKWLKLTAFILFCCLIVQLTSGMSVAAASGIKIYNYTTGKTTTYTGKQVKYVCNGNPVSLPNTPGIIIDGVALGPYEDIFQKTYGMKCTLSKDGKKVTIEYNKNKIVLTLGSKKAVVNGKTKTMTVAPVKIKYTANGKIKYLVPTRFVSESLGMRYSWTSGLSTASITRSISLKYGGETHAYSGNLCRASIDDTIFESAAAPNIIIANTAMVHGKKFFQDIVGAKYQYSKETKSVTISLGTIKIEMKLGNTVAYVNGQVTDCGVAPQLVTYVDTKEEAILVPAYFVAKTLGFDYEWDGVTKTSVLTRTNKTGEYKGETSLDENGVITDSTESITTSGESKPYENAEIYFSWKSESSIPKTFQQASIIDTANNSETVSETLPSINSIFKENSKSDAQKEVYYINFSSPVYEVENLGFNESDLLVLRFNNVLCSERFYTLNGSLISHMATNVTQTPSQSEVTLQLSSNQLNYEFQFSEDHNYLIFTVYNNQLTEITAGRYSSDTEFLEVKGASAIHAELIDSNETLYIEFPYIVNLLGTREEFKFQETSSLQAVQLMDVQSNQSRMQIQKGSHAAVSSETDAEENTFTLYFKSTSENTDTNDTNTTDDTSSNTQENTNTETTTPEDEKNEDETSQETQIPETEELTQRYLSIDLPQGMNPSMISDEDRYYDRQIILTLPGDYTAFYKEHPIKNTCDIVSSIQITAKGDQTIITVTTDKVQAYLIEYEENILRLVMDVPSKFYNKIVVLDAGHGGTDPGATKSGVNEKDLNFKILNQYVGEYFKNSDIKVYYTRVDDTLIDLYDRAAYSTELDADFFVSLHMNSSTSSASNGTGVYYSTVNTSKTESGLTSKIMASSFVNALSSVLSTKNNGPLTANFVVIRETKVPAVLIELAFLSNSGDFKKLTNESYQKKAAKTIYDTIVSLFESYPTNR